MPRQTICARPVAARALPLAVLVLIAAAVVLAVLSGYDVHVATALAAAPFSVAVLPHAAFSSRSPVLTVIVRAMPKHAAAMPLLLLSLLSSPPTTGRVAVVIVRTYERGPDDRTFEGIADLVNSLIPGTPVVVSALDDTAIPKAFPRIAPFPTWARDGGYILTDLLLEDVLSRRAAAGGGHPSDALLVTNGDNLYARDFTTAVGAALARGADLVATHFVSHYEFSGARIVGRGNNGGGPLRAGRDVEIVPAFITGQVDLGAVVMRLELLKRTGERFVIDRLHSTDPSGASIDFLQADGRLFETLAARKDVASEVIPRILFIHQ